MARGAETLEDYIELYEKRLQRASDNYQASGEARYDRQVYEFEMILSGLAAKQREKSLLEHEKAKRTRNCEWQCNRLVKPKYSRGEVIEMLHDAIDW